MTARPTVGSLVLEAAGRLEAAGVSFGHGTTNAFDEAAWLVMRALGRAPGDVAPIAGEPVEPAGAKAARALVARRIRTRKPAAYLLNEAWLGADRFYVDERVIVPRSFIAEMARDRFEPWVADPARVASALDLCTGSGCLAILLAHAYPEADVDAVDLSSDALAVAQRNVADYGLAGRINLIRSDLCANLVEKGYDLIISNPPYVTDRSMEALPAEYRHEPAMALSGAPWGARQARQRSNGVTVVGASAESSLSCQAWLRASASSAQPLRSQRV